MRTIKDSTGLDGKVLDRTELDITIVDRTVLYRTVDRTIPNNRTVLD